MTLKQIAAQAGVSISTVSRIINAPDGSFARKEVRDRVWAIIQETGYTPNQSARALKRGAVRAEETADGALACILGRTKTLDENPFFAQLARAIEQQAMEQRYQVASCLNNGMIYNDILAETGASSATISRVNRSLQYGAGGYEIVFGREREPRK